VTHRSSNWVIREAAILAACAMAVLGAAAARAAETAETILQRTRAMYGDLGSYSDSGVVLQEYGPAASPGKGKHTFATSFKRVPRHFLFDFRKEGGDEFVIWGDPDAFHTWWKTTGVQGDYPNPNNLPAFNLSDFQTSGSATKIPVLLYPKAALVGSLSHFADAALDGNEEIGGHPCYRLVGRTNDVYGQTGKEVNVRKLTLWIATDTLLIRQTREESKAGPGEINRVTITFDPKVNPALEVSRFKFVPPESQ
jgi:outer membrane lipoprotein-sorting protein